MTSTTDPEESRRASLVRILLIVSVPLWAALAIINALMIWLIGLDSTPFVVGILFPSVIFYWLMVRSVTERLTASSTGSTQLEMSNVRQELRLLGDKLDGLRRSLEE